MERRVNAMTERMLAIEVDPRWDGRNMFGEAAGCKSKMEVITKIYGQR